MLQERVPYDDPIVLPAGEGLNIVRRRLDGQLTYRCDCGHDFCAHNRNWKMDAVVHVRETGARCSRSTRRWPGPIRSSSRSASTTAPRARASSRWRPSSPGYPVVHEFLPDVEGFYRGWLGREVPA